MASAANLENKQTSNKAYRKTKHYPTKLKDICEHLSLNCICNIVVGFFFAYRPAFLAVVLGYHRAIKKQPQGVFEKNFIKYL